MAVDDLWYLKKKDANGDRIPSKRHGRGKRYRVRWTNPDTGGRREELFKKKSDAERHDVNMRADISQGRYIDPRAGKVTVREYAELWQRQQLHRDSTTEMVERAFRLHVNPLLGDRALSEVRKSHVQAWVKDRSEHLGASTVHLVYGYLASMLRAAVADKVIGLTPCVGVRLPAIERDKRFIPTPQQVHALAAALPERYRAVPYLAAGCGLRPSEIFGLEIEHVPFLRREVHVRQQLAYKTGEGRYLGPTKTPTSMRDVELPDVVSRALSRQMQAHPPLVIELPDRTDPRKPVTREACLLFSTSRDQPVLRSTWSGVWRSAVRRAELPEGFGLHGLRHYYATLLIHNGASVKTVQLSLGHSTPTITLNTYTHEWPDAIDRTRSLVDAALGPEADNDSAEEAQ